MATRVQATAIATAFNANGSASFPSPVEPGRLIVIYADFGGGNEATDWNDHFADDQGNSYTWVSIGNFAGESPTAVGWTINTGSGNVTEINLTRDVGGGNAYGQALFYAEEWIGQEPTQSWSAKYFGSLDKFLTTDSITNVPGTAVVALGAWDNNNPTTGYDFVPPDWTRLEFSHGNRTTIGTSFKEVTSAGAITADFDDLAKSNLHFIIVYIEDDAASGPTITTQPTSQTVTAPASAEFGPVAAAGEGTLSYQWRYRVGSEGTPANVDFGTGGTSTTFNTGVNTTSRSGWQFQVLVTDDNGTTESDWATLTVEASSDAFIRETLINKSGAPRANETGLLALIWRSTPTAGSPGPDQAISGLTTNAQGETDWTIDLGSLQPGDPIWLSVLRDGAEPIATMVKIVPDYE